MRLHSVADRTTRLARVHISPFNEMLWLCAPNLTLHVQRGEELLMAESFIPHKFTWQMEDKLIASGRGEAVFKHSYRFSYHALKKLKEHNPDLLIVMKRSVADLPYTFYKEDKTVGLFINKDVGLGVEVIPDNEYEAYAKAKVLRLIAEGHIKTQGDLCIAFHQYAIGYVFPHDSNISDSVAHFLGFTNASLLMKECRKNA